MQEPFSQPAPLLIEPEIEGPVFTNNAIHGPHAGDVIAPPGRPARHRNDLEPGAPQVPQGLIGNRRDPAGSGDGVIDVEENAPEAFGYLGWDVLNGRYHHGKVFVVIVWTGPHAD